MKENKRRYNQVKLKKIKYRQSLRNKNECQEKETKLEIFCH